MMDQYDFPEDVRWMQQVDLESVWNLRQRAMWPDCSLEFVKIPDDAAAWHPGLYADGQLASVLSVFLDHKNEKTAIIRKFCTDPVWQHRGLGTRLLKEVICQLKQKGYRTIQLDARVNKTGFYERQGFVCAGEVFEKYGKPYQTMILATKNSLD